MPAPKKGLGPGDAYRHRRSKVDVALYIQRAAMAIQQRFDNRQPKAATFLRPIRIGLRAHKWLDNKGHFFRWNCRAGVVDCNGMLTFQRPRF
jgi:hypothetical protein